MRVLTRIALASRGKESDRKPKMATPRPSTRWRKGSLFQGATNQKATVGPEIIELETELPSHLAGAPSVKDATNRRGYINPVASPWELERHQDFLPRNNRIRRSDKHPPRRQVLDAIRYETKVSFANDLAGNANGVSRWTLLEFSVVSHGGSSSVPSFQHPTKSVNKSGQM